MATLQSPLLLYFLVQVDIGVTNDIIVAFNQRSDDPVVHGESRSQSAMEAMNLTLPGSTPTSRRRVLVVDDEREIAFSLSKILEKSGFETQSALNGEQALEVAKSFLPDILLTDFAMPGINGLDLAVEITKILPACQVILLSGHELVARFAPYATMGYQFLLLSKPMPPRELLEAMRHQVPSVETQTYRPKILHVDDVESHRYSLTRLLTHAGFEVSAAGTGEEAMRQAVENPPDLIVLDINLPGMNGFDVCKELKERPETAHVTVVHLTASSANPEAAARSLSVGADEFMTEPFVPAQLIARLRSLVQAKYFHAADPEADEK